MKFVSVRELRQQSSAVWKAAGATELVLTSNGKPVAIMVGIEDGDLESTLEAIRRARAMSLVSRMRLAAARAEASGLSPAEIEAEIQAARHPASHG
jgi:prevent-host-death family protein